MRAEQPQTCEFCDGALEERVVRARFQHRGQTIYINHVPAWVCRRCGEQEFDGPVYERMEEIAREPGRIVNTITIPLAEYDAGPPRRAGSVKRSRRTPVMAHR
ncbi:MAG: YgiT-type zinc finger protein [Planctomycetes bacterium]|nr:YgiT-type zinc finger protein [Planctomycetota bacterium]